MVSNAKPFSFAGCGPGGSTRETSDRVTQSTADAIPSDRVTRSTIALISNHLPSHPVTSEPQKIKPMIFEPGNIYHLFNQGNNREKIFFNKENYLYFVKKIKHHICPLADILAWCLMPNHFHLLFAVREDHLSDHVTTHSTDVSFNNNLSSHPVTCKPGHPVTPGAVQELPLNNAIATMLRSYTRAINIQQDRTGSLFREGTNAKWIGNLKGELIKYQHRTDKQIRSEAFEEKEYLQTCFSYIHENPVEARLVKNAEDWEFSSARAITEIRTDSIININLITALGLHLDLK